MESLKSERSKDDKVRFDPATNSPYSNEEIPAEGGDEQERKVPVGDETEGKKRSEEKSSEGGEVGSANEGEGEMIAVNEEENEDGDPTEEVAGSQEVAGSEVASSEAAVSEEGAGPEETVDVSSDD